MAYEDRIVIGVNGSAGSDAAIRFGAKEAVRRDTGLHLVHVMPDYVPVAPMYPPFYELTPAAVEATGRKLLDDAARLGRQYAATDRISTALLAGDRVNALVEESRHAVLMVLGDEKLPFLERAMVGSTIDGAAARSLAPLVVVAPSWSGAPEHHEVVVGVRTAAHSAALVEAGLVAARERHAALVLAHAWDLPGLEEDAIGRRTDRELWMEEEWRAIAEAAASLRDAYRDVDVEIRVVHGRPATVLEKLSAEADLLIVARRHHPFPVGHFGQTGRSLLRAAACPVEVLPPVPEWATAPVPAQRQEPAAPRLAQS